MQQSIYSARWADGNVQRAAIGALSADKRLKGFEMARNHYARTLGFPMTVHAFGTKSERDAYVDADWSRHAIEDADGAQLIAICNGGILLHGDARIPRNWREGTVWDYERTDDPNVVRAFIEYTR